MKSRDGKSQRREEKKKEDQKRESLRRKKIQVREKVGKSRNTVFFQWFVAPESRNVGSLKRRVRSHVVRWEMKSCTPLWRKAHPKSRYDLPALHRNLPTFLSTLPISWYRIESLYIQSGMFLDRSADPSSLNIPNICRTVYVGRDAYSMLVYNKMW